MFTELKKIPEVWRKVWASTTFRNQLVLSVLVLIGVCLYQFHYLRIWQERSGLQVNDFLESYLPPYNFSVPIFILEYSTLLMVFIYTLIHPDKLVKGLQMFSIIMIARTISIYFVPLEPPHDMIFLTDPIANLVLHSKNVVVTKDLFFSGHISALTLLALLVSNRYLKYYAIFVTITVAILLVWQHVHYSMDVAFAPIASYLTYRFIWWAHSQTKYGIEFQDA